MQGAVPKLFRGLSGHELNLGMDINYKTTLNVAHQIALAEQTKEHHLIIFSSATALYPFVGYSQYAPAKAAIKSLVAILRQELTNFRISCVYPGNFESEGFTVEQLTKPEITKLIEGPQTLSHANKHVISLPSRWPEVMMTFLQILSDG